MARHHAAQDGKGLVLISDLAKREAIPKKFLEQILLVLKHDGIVESKKGKGGGYALALPPDSITMGRVIRAMEGPLAPLPCASETGYRACEECPDPETCETRIVMREVRDATAKILDRITLADACRRGDAARVDAQAAEGLMYYI
jgi:Rrf2 family protein